MNERQQVVETARRAAARGWLPATSGNFSVRAADGTVHVTPSGVDKGALTADALLALSPEGSPIDPTARASAETHLHLARYAADPAVGAVVHVHAANAVLVSRRFSRAVTLGGFELLKAFVGIETHEARLVVPIVENDQDMAALATRAEQAVAEFAPTWGYLVRGHGLYTWGPDVASAERHAEAFDVLFHYLLMESR